ncbi:MAG: peptide chain release factor-like protein [Leptospiraceae bacterium]|nr:peptide chain release factor-like protein [Leptospiraceae bacterium]
MNSPSFPVSPKKQRELESRMEALGIWESDLEESFVKGGGHGGQNVNKTSTAVHLKHIPTGIEVRCNVYRTQGLNRYKARAILCEKLELERKVGKKFQEIQKIRKNKERKARRRKKNESERRRTDFYSDQD